MVDLDFSKCKSVEDVMDVFENNKEQMIEIGKIIKVLERIKNDKRKRT